ncbi:hypothetical protein D1872_244550 [compost metagenome]
MRTDDQAIGLQTADERSHGGGADPHQLADCRDGDAPRVVEAPFFNHGKNAELAGFVTLEDLLVPVRPPETGNRLHQSLGSRFTAHIHLIPPNIYTV